MDNTQTTLEDTNETEAPREAVPEKERAPNLEAKNVLGCAPVPKTVHARAPETKKTGQQQTTFAWPTQPPPGALQAAAPLPFSFPPSTEVRVVVARVCAWFTNMGFVALRRISLRPERSKSPRLTRCASLCE